MSRVIAVVNQKGGAGKSTVTANLSVAWAAPPLSRRMLAIDLDPQRNLTSMLGVRADETQRTLADVFAGEAGVGEVALRLPAEVGAGVSLVPGDARMKDHEATLIVQTRREEFLAEFLEGELEGFDVVLIDCPPNLGTLTVNAIFAAGELVVPIAMNDRNAYNGAADLLATLDQLRGRRIDVPVTCLIRNEVDRRRNAFATLDGALPALGVPVARTEIPRRAAFEDAAILGRPVASARPYSPGGAAFLALARELEQLGAGSRPTREAA
jgi:chromosome partitioning protein